MSIEKSTTVDMPARIKGINHLTLAVTDLETSFRFYKDILQFKPLCKWNKGAYFLVGDLWFCLNLDPTYKAAQGYTHYAFSVSKSDFLSIKERLLSAGIEPFKENNSPGDSFYFLDPDGHKLEIHTGNWQERLAAKKQIPGTWQEVEWF